MWRALTVLIAAIPAFTLAAGTNAAHCACISPDSERIPAVARWNFAQAGSRQRTAQLSGIEGQVTIRPIRPHATAGADNSEPYEATIQVLNEAGQVVDTVRTDSDGRFRVPLVAGKYVLRPESPNKYPRASEQTIVVRPKAFSAVRIIYDSGMR